MPPILPARASGRKAPRSQAPLGNASAEAPLRERLWAEPSQNKRLGPRTKRSFEWPVPKQSLGTRCTGLRLNLHVLKRLGEHTEERVDILLAVIPVQGDAQAAGMGHDVDLVQPQVSGDFVEFGMAESDDSGHMIGIDRREQLDGHFL